MIMAVALLKISPPGGVSSFRKILHWSPLHLCTETLLKSRPSLGECLVLIKPMRLIDFSAFESCLTTQNLSFLQFKKLHDILPRQLLSFTPFYILWCLMRLGKVQRHVILCHLWLRIAWLCCINSHLLLGI